MGADGQESLRYGKDGPVEGLCYVTTDIDRGPRMPPVLESEFEHKVVCFVHLNHLWLWFVIFEHALLLCGISRSC